MSFDRHPALLKLKKARVARGKYMTVDLVMPERYQPAVAIALNLSHTPLKREDAEYLAAAIQRLPDMIEALLYIKQLTDDGYTSLGPNGNELLQTALDGI